MKKKKRKLKWVNIILLLVILLFMILFIVSIINIIKWKIDSNKIEEQVQGIQDIVHIEEVNDADNIEIEIIEQEDVIPKTNPYWDYLKMNLINVDFNDLKDINMDTEGWIQVNGTNINYPFVQTKDNKYYLNHSFNKTNNDAGWVFLDYRNNINSLSKNTIIYAHGRLDDTMFGSLKNILKSGWLNDSSNYVVKLSTETENTLWQVFSVYRIPTTSDYIRVNFNSNEDFITWSSMLIDRSAYNFDTTVSQNDHVLTLSTCYNDDDKVVLHAKLIKKETR